MALESPFAPQHFVHQLAVGAAGLAVGAVISAHYGLYLAFFDAGLKGGEVLLPQLLLADHGVKVMPQALQDRSGRRSAWRRQPFSYVPPSPWRPRMNRTPRRLMR